MTQSIESPFLGEVNPRPPRNGGAHEGDFLSATPFVGTFTLTRSRFMPQTNAGEIDDETGSDHELGEAFEMIGDDAEAPETSDFELLGETDDDTGLLGEIEAEFDAETGFDPASNEGASAEVAYPTDEVAYAAEEVSYPAEASADEIDHFDAELFQQLVSLGPAVEQALVSAQIAGGQRNDRHDRASADTEQQRGSERGDGDAAEAERLGVIGRTHQIDPIAGYTPRGYIELVVSEVACPGGASHRPHSRSTPAAFASFEEWT